MHMRTNSEFGEKLQALMQRHDVTQVALARLCGLTKSAPVYGWIKTGRINRQNLSKVAAYFGFTSDTLYGKTLEDILALDAAMDPDLKARQAVHVPPNLDAAITAPAANPLSELHPLAVDSALIMQRLVAADPRLDLIHEAHAKLWEMVQDLLRQRAKPRSESAGDGAA